MILRELGHIDGGRLLDVGAWTGREFSNSLALIELGWSGVLVEPSPGPFKALTELHRSRPHLELVNAAATLEPCPEGVKLYATDDAISTTEEAHMRKWLSWGSPFTVVTAAAVSVDELAAKGPFDFVNVDTESTSVPLGLALLRRMKADKQLPTLVCVEYDDQEARLRRELVNLGYEVVHVTAENMLARRRK